MSWDLEKSEERVEAHLASMGEIEITPLARKVEYLEALLSESECKQVDGAHVYAEVSNFQKLATETTQDELRGTIRALHVFQRNATKIVEDTFGSIFVHWQGPRLHAVAYRPVGDQEAIAVQAVLLQLVLADFTTSVFNPAVSGVGDFKVRSGSAIGIAIATLNGVKGDRELLFVGDPANDAAHAISGVARAVVTKGIEQALPADLRAKIVVTGDGYRIIALSKTEIDAATKKHGYAYDRGVLAKAVADDLRSIPLKDVEYADAQVLVDFESLSVRRSKRIFAASVFADIDGFTKCIHEAGTDEEKKPLLLGFAAVRKELAFVVRRDHEGRRVQYQGDRQQSLFHLPSGDERKIAEAALQAAVAQLSSFELVLKEKIPALAPLKLTIGVDMGITIATRLGGYGKRDRICIGDAVYEAAAIQEKCHGDEIGISKTVRDALRPAWRELFKWDARGFYVAKGLRADDLEYADGARDFANKNVWVKTGAMASVTPTVVEGARSVTPARSWSDD